jgi:hypothetical protein
MVRSVDVGGGAVQMLAMSHDAQEYVDACRARMDVQLSTHRDLANVARSHIGANEETSRTAIGSFEPVFFNDQLGDEIGLDEAGFLLVLGAFLAEIERKFVAT